MTAQPAPAPGASTIYVSPANPATDYGGIDYSNPTPALRALPVNPSDIGGDASLHRKFYTLTASLREIYDSNSNTASGSNAEASFETSLTPSVLVDFPTTDGDFSGRYSAGLTYYSNGQSNNGNGGSTNTGNNNNQGSLEISHELNAQYSRAISNRFQLALAEDLRYNTDPNILQSTGTNYQDGAYISNTLNGSLSAQWTPLLSTSASLSNTVVHYEDALVADTQDNVETSGSLSVGYAVLPKITASVGSTVDNITYQTADRGYTNYTLFLGASWQALPSLSTNASAGASYAQTQGGESENSLSPYASLSLSWTLGERSSLSFSYSHQVTPSDQAGANGQESDRLATGFSYQITPRLTSHLDGIITFANVPSDLATTEGSTVPSASGYQETVYDIDTSLAYAYTANVSFDLGLTFSGVDSNNSNNNYTRDEAYIGVRGTY